MLRRSLTDAMLFHPERGQSRGPGDLGMAYDELTLTTDDGVAIQAWWIPGAADRPVLVFLHGNAGTMADRLENTRMFADLGLSIVTVEYRGYGDSAGRPDERGLYADGRAGLAAARRRAGARKVVVFGRSLGGAVAVDVAAHGRVDGLAIESTFTSLPAMARVTRIPFAARVVAYKFDSLTKISGVTAPTLIAHGDADELVPFAMGEQLCAAAGGEVVFHRVRGGDHNSTWVSGGEAYWQAWHSFIDLVCAS